MDLPYHPACPVQQHEEADPDRYVTLDFRWPMRSMNFGLLKPLGARVQPVLQVHPGIFHCGMINPYAPLAEVSDFHRLGSLVSSEEQHVLGHSHQVCCAGVLDLTQ